MAPLVRHAPGERAPIAGTYALVGHYGEATGFCVECEAGDRLPLVSVTADYEAIWFVLVGEAIAISKAA